MFNLGGSGVMAINYMLATGAGANAYLPMQIPEEEPVIRVYISTSDDYTTASQYDYGFMRQLHDFHRSYITAYDEANVLQNSIRVATFINDVLPVNEDDEAIVNEVMMEKLTSRKSTKISKASNRLS